MKWDTKSLFIFNKTLSSSQLFQSTTKDLRSSVGESCHLGRNLSHLHDIIDEPCMICLLAGVAPANRPHYYQAELNIWIWRVGCTESKLRETPHSDAPEFSCGNLSMEEGHWSRTCSLTYHMKKMEAKESQFNFHSKGPKACTSLPTSQNFMFNQDTWDLANVAQCSAGGLILALSIPSVGIGSIFGGKTREFH